MNPRKILLAAAAAAFVTMPLPSAADKAFARSKGCIACHDIDTKLVGPGFKEVKNKYKADKDAEAKLVTSIVKGSTGKWGSVPMPPNKISDEEAKKLAAWILSL